MSATSPDYELVANGGLSEVRSLKFALEVTFAPADLGAQDLVESALRDALERVREDGLEQIGRAHV